MISIFGAKVNMDGLVSFVGHARIHIKPGRDIVAGCPAYSVAVLWQKRLETVGRTVSEQCQDVV